MKLTFSTGWLRVLLQLALSAAVILFLPWLVVLCAKIAQAAVRHNWTEVGAGKLVLPGLLGVLALCVSIFVTRRFFERHRGLRIFLTGGLGCGLFVAFVVLWRLAPVGVDVTRDWLLLYLTVGPVLVALWNLGRFWKWANQLPDVAKQVEK